MSTRLRGIRDYLEERIAERTLGLKDANARLEREVVERQRLEQAEREQRILAEALRDTAAALTSTLNLEEVLDRILVNVGLVVPHEASNIALVKSGVAHIARCQGYLDKKIETAILGLQFDLATTPNLRWMAETGRPLIIADTQAYTGWVDVPEARWLHSYLGAPIQVQGDTVGFIHLQAAPVSFFTPAHARRLEAFTDQAAAAVENARVFEKSQQQAQRLALVNQISAEINRPLELESVLQALVDGLARVLRVNQTGLALFDEQRHYLVGVADHPAPGSISAVGVRLPVVGNLSVQRILDTRQPVAIDDAQNDPLLSSIHEVMVQRCVRSILIVPLIVRGEVIGTIGCDALGTLRKFTVEEIKLAETVANLAAVRIEQARLFEAESAARREAEQNAVELHQLARRAALLNDITQASIGAPDLQSMLDTLAGRLGELVGADGAYLSQWDEIRQTVIPTAAYGPMRQQYLSLQPEPGETTMTVSVLQTGQVLVVEDILNCADVSPRLATRFPARSLLVLPLISDGHKLGAAMIGFARAHTFTPDEVALCEQAARQISLAIYKAGLLESERLRTAQLARTNGLILALGHVAALIESAPDPDRVMQTLGAELEKLNLYCMVAVKPGAGQELTIRYVSIPPKALRLVQRLTGGRLQNLRITAANFPLFSEVIEQRQPVFLKDSSAVLTAALPGRPASAIRRISQLLGSNHNVQEVFLPLVAEERVIGTLWMWGSELKEADLPAVSIFASQVAVALENARLYQEVQQLAVTDELTGLYNRRGLFALGQREVEIARRLDRPLSLIMADIDHFKQVNDEFGHPAGDQVLRVLAEQCRALVRSIDLVGRYGGEELVILLVESDKEATRQVAERLCSFVAKTRIVTEWGDLHITVSIGVVEVDRNTEDLETLVERADQALYQAKNTGRNCVVVQ